MVCSQAGRDVNGFKDCSLWQIGFTALILQVVPRSVDVGAPDWCQTPPVAPVAWRCGLCFGYDWVRKEPVQSLSPLSPTPHQFVIHYLLLSCSWQASAGLTAQSQSWALCLMTVSFLPHLSLFFWKFMPVCAGIAAAGRGKGARRCVLAFALSAACRLNVLMC